MAETIATLSALFASQAGQRYLGEPVRVATHMLQAAAHFETAGAPDALVAAALRDDAGHVQRTRAAHEQAGADWLARWFGPEVTEPVRLHVDAKRYLCTVEQGNIQRFSPASIESLARQGGPMSAAEVAAFEHFVPVLRRVLTVR